jgi:hypothetical protein
MLLRGRVFASLKKKIGVVTVPQRVLAFKRAVLRPEVGDELYTIAFMSSGAVWGASEAMWGCNGDECFLLRARVAVPKAVTHGVAGGVVGFFAPVTLPMIGVGLFIAHIYTYTDTWKRKDGYREKKSPA